MKKLFIILFIVLLPTCFFLINKNAKKKTSTATVKRVQNKTAYNFVLLGYGGGAHEGTYLTDTMMLVHININTKQVVLFSIPRDTWVKLPTKSGSSFHIKINAVYQLGLFPKTYPDVKINGENPIKNAVFQISGLPIDGYVAVNFEGFIKAIDILGGVDVTVAKSFTDPEYPIDGKEKDLCDKDTEDLFNKAQVFLTPGFNPEQRDQQFKDEPKLEEFIKNATDSPELAFPCRYEKLEFEKGITHMDGATALKYARSRHSSTDGGDFNRARRQQEIIEAVKNKVLSIGVITKIIPLINEVKKNVETDIDSQIITKLLSQINKIKEYTIKTFVISTENLLMEDISNDGQYILIPKKGIDNWFEARQIIASQSAIIK